MLIFNDTGHSNSWLGTEQDIGRCYAFVWFLADHLSLPIDAIITLGITQNLVGRMPTGPRVIPDAKTAAITW